MVGSDELCELELLASKSRLGFVAVEAAAFDFASSCYFGGLSGGYPWLPTPLAHLAGAAELQLDL